MEHCGIDRPALVGHDIGDGIVTRADLVDAVPIRRLALLDAAVDNPAAVSEVLGGFLA